MTADIEGVEDRGEPTSLMEPLLIATDSRHRPALTDLALELAARSAGLHRSLPTALRGALAHIVRAMNCYYSNLIEGHDTHPVDIERALAGDYSQDAHRRDLQIEARAHIAVQHWIDGGGLEALPTTRRAITEIHRRFCEQLPEDLLAVEMPAGRHNIRLIPGELRRQDVVVGRHIPISAPAVPRFLTRYEEVYGGLGKTESVMAAAAAHHRLLWIHPFLDGNGRVARLVSHATLLQTLDTGALWSIARGLARHVDDYKGYLAACDLPRRNDLDERGPLSEEALVAFTQFFLHTCLDQVRFMEELMQPGHLRARILLWAEDEIRLNRLPPKATRILEALLYRGELPRSEAAAIVDAGERHARRIVSALMDRGAISSEGPRSPLHLAFPATFAPRWMPGLFPEKRA
jgi:Fic family protein